MSRPAPAHLSPSWPLICPVCGLDLSVRRRPDGRVSGLDCPGGHGYDAARQGHVSLLSGRGSRFTQDSPEMVASRERWLGAGHYAALTDALARLATRHLAARRDQKRTMVIDTGAGTGHYTRAVLDALATDGHTPRAVDLDLSRAAAQRAAHDPRVVSIVWDTWKPWPVHAGGADLLLDVFAPRNAAEFTRVVRRGGLALVAVPAAGHLEELAQDGGLLGIDPRKEERLAEVFAQGWEALETVPVTSSMQLPVDAAADLVHMGPAGHHRTLEQIREQLSEGAPERAVTAAFAVHAYRRTPVDHPRG